MPSFDEIYESTMEGLKNRTGWERKLARNEAQRFCQDRQHVNNYPWPRASNIRYPLSAIIIDQTKPFLYKVLHSAEHVATFKALVSSNVEFALGCEAYFDFHIREQTNFERVIQYVLDTGLQDGEAYLKVMWDTRKKTTVFVNIEPLFIITPDDCQELEESPWVTHVLQLTADVVLKRFRDVPDIQGFVTRNKGKKDHGSGSDSEDKQDLQYDRAGINRSEKERLVLWERHYIDEDGNRRLVTTSPDEPKFDFQDDRAYPYEFASKSDEYMIFQYRREIIKPDLHSSRGIPELVQDGEFVLTSAWRTWQNWETLAGNPVYEAPNGIPGSVTNLTMSPGKVNPFALNLVQQPSCPVDWQQQMGFTREVFERVAATPDFGIGKGNTLQDSRTATEVNKISNLQGLNSELITGNWKAFMRKVFRASWALNVQYKPDSLNYFLDTELKTLDQSALNNDYQIAVSGSADSIDKEFMINKMIALFNLNKGNPNANLSELTKEIFSIGTPGQVQRFWVDTQQRQMDNMLKAADDISIILTTGVEVHPDPGEDFATNAITAVSIMSNKAQTGVPMTPLQVQLVTQYVSENRDALKKTNKQAYEQLNQQLNAFDMQQQQQFHAQLAAPTALSGVPPHTLPIAPQRQPGAAQLQAQMVAA